MYCSYNLTICCKDDCFNKNIIIIIIIQKTSILHKVSINGKDLTYRAHSLSKRLQTEQVNLVAF